MTYKRIELPTLVEPIYGDAIAALTDKHIITPQLETVIRELFTQVVKTQGKQGVMTDRYIDTGDNRIIGLVYPVFVAPQELTKPNQANLFRMEGQYDLINQIYTATSMEATIPMPNYHSANDDTVRAFLVEHVYGEMSVSAEDLKVEVKR